MLLGLDALGRQLGSERGTPRLGPLRSYVDETLESLRKLAVSLRPPVLDGIGLVPALERLAAELPERRGRVMIDAHGLGDRLPADVETAVYRVVEEAISTFPALRSPATRRSWGRNWGHDYSKSLQPGSWLSNAHGLVVEDHPLRRR